MKALPGTLAPGPENIPKTPGREKIKSTEEQGTFIVVQQARDTREDDS